jgi:signal transduction histidine kinase
VLSTTRPVDWLMVASLLLLAWFEVWVEPLFQTGLPGPRLPLTLLTTLSLAPLLARKAFPLGALGVMCLGVLAVGVVADSHQSAFVLVLGLLVATYSVAAHATPRRALAGAALVVVTAVLVQSLTFEQKTLVDVVVPGLFLAAAWIVGREVHRQRQRAGELAEHTALLARTHRLEMHAAVAAERTRIARELHDVVAHAISVMGIQASAARRTLEPGHAPQRQALLDVERLGREALDEMQRMLGVLRTGEDDQGAEPLPGLTELPTLAEDARTTGVEVEVELAGEPERLPQGVQLTAFRIVQEALTNVRKHARATRVRVRIARCGDHLELTVADDGNGASGEPEPGNGLIGMRERVAAHHGTLYAGPGDEQGFVVRARLPARVDP